MNELVRIQVLLDDIHAADQGMRVVSSDVELLLAARKSAPLNKALYDLSEQTRRLKHLLYSKEPMSWDKVKP